MESTESPQGVYGKSMRSFHGVHYVLESLSELHVGSSWTPHGVHIESMWTLCRLYEIQPWTPSKVHGVLKDSTPSPHRVLMESM